MGPREAYIMLVSAWVYVLQHDSMNIKAMDIISSCKTFSGLGENGKDLTEYAYDRANAKWGLNK